MFFKTHAEGKIGYKELTKADLGDGAGNTTHIGLFGDVLQFLPNRDHSDNSMFIYNNECMSLGFSFDRIQNPNGTYRSPKIRKGGKDVASVVTVIGDLYKNNDHSYRWFLIWFALESEEVVFYLFNNNSVDYKSVCSYLDLEQNMCKGRIARGEDNFDPIIHYLESIVNASNQELIADLEVVSQVRKTDKKYRRFDIERANQLFKEIGRKGEELIAEYLDNLKHRNQITSFNWVNQSLESGLPYDFTIQNLRDNITYLDVKSTSQKFEQKMILSGQEIEFIPTMPNYHIYRVYDLLQEQGQLKICENSKELANLLNSKIQKLSDDLNQDNVALQSTKLAIPTAHEMLIFGNAINL